MSAPWLAGLLALSVAVPAVLVMGVPAASALPTSAAAPAKGTGPAQAPDEKSARLTATLLGRRVEILSERTADESVYANPNGTTTAEAYAGPVRVKQADGTWRTVDTDLTDVGAHLEPQVSPADVTVSDGGDKALVSVTRGSKVFGLDWPDRLPAPTVDGDTASYDVGDDATLTVKALAQGFEQSVVLDKAPTEPAVYRIPLHTDALTLSQADSGHLLLKDTDGKPVAEAPAPMMWDSSKDKASGEPKHRARVATKVETADDGSQTLVLTPDPDFLAGDITYPVTIDPTSTLAVTTDTWLQTPDYPDSQVSSTELKSGTYDAGSDKARSYLKFDVSKFAGKHITDTNLALYSYYSSTCSTSGSGTTVRRITSSWSSSSVTWATRPSSTATGAVVNTGAHGYSSSSCPAAWSNWDIDAIVQAWADGSSNYGLVVYGTDETDSTTWRRFRSANYSDSAYAPKLTVTYNTRPGTPTAVAPTSGTATADTTPTLQAKATDADANTVRLTFEVWDSTGTTRKASGTSAYVTSGSTASWTPPALADGTYKWRAQASDGTDSGSWSAWNTLTVDSSGPTAPTVTSSSHPSSSSWYSTGDFAGTLAASAPSGVAGYAVRTDQSPTTAPGTTVTQTGTAVTATGRADGTWYVHAAAKGNTGLWSATRHFAFNVDTTAPGAPTGLTSGTHPLSTSAYNSRTASFSWTAPADLSGAAGYAIKVDTTSGTLPATTDAYQTGTAYTATVSADGTYYAHVRAKDKAGNWSANAAQFKFTVDTTLPAVPTVGSDTHPDQSAAYPSGDFHATWSAPTGGATAYSLLVDGSATTVPDTTADTTGTEYRVTKGDGTWYLHIRAKDSAGNWGATAHFRFVVDSTAPAPPSIASEDYPATAWAGAAGTPGLFTLTPPASDAVALRYRVDSGTTVTVGTAGDPAEIQVTPAAEGSHTMTAWTVDLAGNTSSATVRTFHVGTARVTSPGSGDRPAASVELAASGPSDLTGVTFAYRVGESAAWTPVPASDTVRASDGSAVGWPVAMTDGASPRLVWKVTHTLTADGPIQIAALFDGAGSPPASDPVDVVVDRDAGAAATAEVGPGNVNLLTGDFQVDATDVSAYDVTLSRTANSRTPDDGSEPDGLVSPFGPQWTVSGVAELTSADYAMVRTPSATAAQAVLGDGTTIGFTLAKDGTWTPEPGAESMALTLDRTKGVVTLTDSDGGTTTFARSAADASVYLVHASTPAPGDATTYVYDTVGSGTSAHQRLVRIVSPSATATTPATTCATNPGSAPAAGCVTVDFGYDTTTTAGSGSLGTYSGRLHSVTAWSPTPSVGPPGARVLATYRYDDKGRLRQAVVAQSASATSTTSYGYDDAGRVTTLTPPGELPWTLAYGSAGDSATADPGMLLSASRPTVTAGSQSDIGGVATTSVVYAVPTSGIAAPYALGAAAVASWGQSVVPTDATAVFPPSQTPSDHTGAGHLTAGDYGRATVHYLDASGRETDTAEPGGDIAGTDYDAHGNPVRTLTAANRRLALGGDDVQDRLDELGLSALTTAERADLLSDTTVYDQDGVNQLETLGPLHPVTLSGGVPASGGMPALDAATVVAARTHTVNHYDQGRPTDGTAVVKNLLTSRTTGIRIPGYLTDADTATDSTTYDWTRGSQPATTTDALGRKTSYTYDGSGRLTRTAFPDGTETSTAYNDLGLPKSGTDQLGHTTTYAYDQAGDKISETSPGGRTTTYTYDSAHNELTETSPAGNVTGADPAAHTTTFTYDAANRELTRTDPLGHTESSVYDDTGQLLSSTDESGAVTGYTYDGSGRVLTETDPMGRVTSHTYDAVGNETATVEPGGGATTRTFGPGHDVLSMTTPAGNVPGADAETKRVNTVLYTYDEAGLQVRQRQVDPQNTDQYLDTVTAYDGQDRSVAVTDPLGDTSTTAYDALDHVLKQTDAGGAATTYTYDELGRVTRQSSTVTTTNTYDGVGRLVRTVTGGGSTTTYTYDEDGRRLSMVDPRGRTTTYSYDADGDRTRVTDPLGRSTASDYDALGHLTKSTDPAGDSTAYAYTPVGKVAEVTDPEGAVTAYTYDKSGALLTTKNPRGRTQTFGYDPTGRLRTATTPSGRTTTYTYDISGRLTDKALPGGTVHYGYDSLGRATSVTHSDSSDDLAYVYDGADRPVVTVQTSTDSTVTSTATQYDAAGRITSVNRAGAAFAYARDARGRITERDLPDGRSQSYAYGDDNLLSSTTLTTPSGTTAKVDYTYDAAGNPLTTTRQNGPTTTRAYDAAGELTSLTHTKGGSTLTRYDVTWNDAGSPATLTTTRGSTAATTLYGYDRSGRLTKECSPASGTTCTSSAPATTYTYDGNGNRTTMTRNGVATTYGYDTDDHLTSESTGAAATAYTYDANGGLASETTGAGKRTYTYGLDGNLQTVTLADGRTVSYGYDETGDRVSRTVAGSTDATWTWDTVDQLATRVAENDSGGSAVHQWWSDPANSLGTAAADTGAGTGTFTWLLDDPNGTIEDTATSAGVTGTATFDAFGEPTGTSGGYATGNPLRFQGQYLDSVTGLYDMRARDYDSGTGRFTAVDPLPATEGTAYADPYDYALDRPTVLSDPTGEYPGCGTCKDTEDRKYKKERPTSHDQVIFNRMANVSRGLAYHGWDNAYALLDHWLDNVGTTFNLHPSSMLKEIPRFRHDVRAYLDGRKRGVFDSGWRKTHADYSGKWKTLDWYYALNHFQWRADGSLQTKYGFTYNLRVRKRYDWGVPSEHRANLKISIPGVLSYDIAQPEIAHLHTVGLARDYNVRGTSKMRKKP
ncbi:DNRLRE domain-containing protein [Streptomyces sp. NRRL B-3229]|uniref:DNRLRE domain-containing protein n=1 Tax=Streptomyces sp. NRRL B-3229 TaxID=1463836 RepID=UPI00131BBFC1|nr:DNRLRE domain-containing protein [Streptomyces sp. NRRL B-3229]